MVLTDDAVHVFVRRRRVLAAVSSARDETQLPLACSSPTQGAVGYGDAALEPGTVSLSEGGDLASLVVNSQCFLCDLS